MAHAQKPGLVFPRNGRVHLNWRGRQFSRLLAAELCASAVVMVVILDKPCSAVERKDYWLPTPLAYFPFTSPTVRHRVPSGFNWAIPPGYRRFVAADRLAHEDGIGRLSWNVANQMPITPRNVPEERRLGLQFDAFPIILRVRQQLAAC